MSDIRHFLTVSLSILLLAAFQEDDAETASSDADVPDILAPQRAACEEDGGRWGAVPGTITFTCFRITKDANQPCETERDCEGLCLARSRTCAPQKPFFGCHEILSASGLRQTICTQ